MRLVALDSELKPVQTEATVEVQDAKGIKIFKQTLATDEYGTVTTELPLSTEPNLGVWKLTASAGDTSTDLDVRVEKYVLPKYEVKVELAKTGSWWTSPSPATWPAQYSFGRPVRGELKVTASRYVGEWEEFATYTAPIDGEGDFSIQPAGYVAGVPEAGGLGNVRLDVAVVEKATGYEEKTTELITVAASPVNIQLIPESTAFKPTLPFGVVLVTETPGGEPVEAAVTVDISYMTEDYQEVGQREPSGRDQPRNGNGAVHASEEGRAHDHHGLVGRRRGLQGADGGLFALGQLHPRAAAGVAYPRRGRHGELPSSVHRRSQHLLLRGGGARPSGLQQQRPGRHLLHGDPGHGAVGAPARLPDPAEQRGGRGLPALRCAGCNTRTR